jgi:hypothetical protein
MLRKICLIKDTISCPAIVRVVGAKLAHRARLAKLDARL